MNKKIRTIYIDDETWEIAKQLAKESKISISSYIILMIRKKKKEK